ncbi:MAG: phosphate-binding protein, partial [Methylobacter sp.]
MKLSFKSKFTRAALGFASAVLVTGTAGAVQSVDPGLPDYQKASGISGNLSSVGSDTLANLMT